MLYMHIVHTMYEWSIRVECLNNLWILKMSQLKFINRLIIIICLELGASERDGFVGVCVGLLWGAIKPDERNGNSTQVEKQWKSLVCCFPLFWHHVPCLVKPKEEKNFARTISNLGLRSALAISWFGLWADERKRERERDAPNESGTKQHTEPKIRGRNEWRHGAQQHFVWVWCDVSRWNAL